MSLRLGLTLYVLCCASLAEAQLARTVLVVLPECASAEDRRELLALLRLELKADAVELDPARDPERAREAESLWLSQNCSAAGRAHAALRYRDRQARESAREVSLFGVERSLQPRVIALALAELLRSSGGEPAIAPAPAPDARAEKPAAETAATPAPEPVVTETTEPKQNAQSAPPPRAATERTPEASQTARRAAWALALGPSFEVMLADGTLSVGATAALEWKRLSFGVLGAVGSSSDKLGSANFQRLHAFAAFAVMRAELGAFGFDLGPRAAAGATFASATPVQEATADHTIDVTSSMSLELAVALQLRAAWRARLRTELGYAFGPRFRADDRTLADFGGIYVGASIVVGLALAP